MYLDIEFATRIMGSLPQSEIVRRGGEFSIHSVVRFVATP